jgi:DNA-binding transcriptional ArsR family regulator
MTMSLRRESKLLGSPRRTQVLVLLALLGESFPSEICRLIDAKKAAVLYILDALEAEGVVVSRPLGRTRRMELDPRFFAAKELRALLLKLAEADDRIQAAAARRRARPRRKGK